MENLYYSEMANKEEEKEEFSGSDFDEDEDPDKTEVPGLYYI